MTVVIYGSERALRQAERLRLGVLENAVEAAIYSGKKKSRAEGVTLHPDEEIVFLRHGVAAAVAKDGRTPAGTRRLRVRRLVQVPTPK
jgi:hypothetical protein